MSKFRNMKLRYKIGVGVASTAAFVAAGGAAFAYFTDGGAGSGSATVGTSTPFVISSTQNGTNYPGQSTTVNLTVNNPGSGSQQIGTIYLAAVKACDPNSTYHAASSADNNVAGCYNSTDTLSAGTPSGSELNGGTPATNCESVDPGNASNAKASDWYMQDVTESQDIAAGKTLNASSTPALAAPTGTLVMNDLNSSQDVCKNANLTLVFATR